MKNLKRIPVQFTITYYTRVNSTNKTARTLWKKNPVEGTVVISTTQFAGRGRNKHTWFSGKGGFYISITLTPFHQENIQLLTFLTSCAVCRTFSALTTIQPRIKWPNDVLVGTHKISGVLTESIFGEHPVFFVGVGININQKKFPPNLQNKATSLFIETSKIHDIQIIEQNFLKHFRNLYTHYINKKFTLLLNEWKKWDSTLGSIVNVMYRGEKIQGIATNVSVNGSLTLKQNDGTFFQLYEGEMNSNNF